MSRLSASENLQLRLRMSFVREEVSPGAAVSPPNTYKKNSESVRTTAELWPYLASGGEPRSDGRFQVNFIRALFENTHVVEHLGSRAPAKSEHAACPRIWSASLQNGCAMAVPRLRAGTAGLLVYPRPGLRVQKLQPIHGLPIRAAAAHHCDEFPEP